ncbi:MAG: bifunctional 5,10-methylenetetrahydrofolate dehydrogenase/5,10-methenyltetrahydrofolate cyclohydrolase [Gaiellaceae bacterium]
MTATLMEGRPLAERIRAEVADDVRELGDVGLATVQVGEDPASTIYIRLKHEAAAQAGIRSVDRKLPAEIAQGDLIAEVAALNDDDTIDGILLQLPLPDGLDEAAAVVAIDPAKDVDGVHPFNAGQLYLGRSTHVPATPLGIMALLTEHRVELDRARAVVIGRSDIVGKPIAHLLLHANATVTICHSHTDELARHTLDADVLVVAAGVPGIVSPDMVKAGSAVVDVGINRTEAGVVGDVDPGAADRAALLTPVPGGVGPMTIALVLQNTVRAAQYRRNLLAFPQNQR